MSMFINMCANIFMAALGFLKGGHDKGLIYGSECVCLCLS